MVAVEEDLVRLLMQPGTDVPTSLADVLANLRPPWAADAACREHPEVDFFPRRGDDAEPARAVCAGCLVRRDCLAYALERDLVGVWGGSTGRNRRKARERGLDVDELLAELDEPRRVVRSTPGPAKPKALREPPPPRPPCERCGGLLGRRDVGPRCWACVDAA